MGGSQKSSFVAVLLVLALTGWDRASSVYTTTQATLCEGLADILFVLDASGSISRHTEYPVMLQFASDVTTQFAVAPDKIRFAAIVYSSSYSNEFGFTDHTNNSQVAAAVSGLPHFGGLTYTGAALRSARTFALTTQNGARPGVSKIVIVITDGFSTNSTDTQIEALLLKLTGATVIAIGVGNGVRVSELDTIASDPSLVFTVNDFNALSTIRDQVALVACPVAQPTCIKSCVGREDGNYAACPPICKDGYFFSCVNEFTYQMPCALAFYTDQNGVRFLARMVYNPDTDTCELSSTNCPRDPEDYQVQQSNGGGPIVQSINNTCLTSYDTCSGRPDGNYPMCAPDCQSGFYYSCSGGETYEMPCPLGTYIDSYGNPFTARLVFDTRTDSCEASIPSCPRNPGDTPYIPPAPPGPSGTYTPPIHCPAQADILFLLDSSGSIGSVNYQILTSFAASLTGSFTMSPNDVQFGCIIFSTNVQVLFNLNTHDNQPDVADAIINAPYLNGLTNTAKALIIARTFGFSSFNGARPSVGKVAIVVTDGVSTRPSDTITEAENLKNSGVTVLAVGIGNNVRQSELLAIATSAAHVFNVASFSGLNLIQAQLVTSTCNHPIPTCLSYSCAGQPDGNYPACDPLCAQGYFISCVSEYLYQMPCPLAYYTDHSGNRFTARMVYNPATDSCELSAVYCPRNPEDYPVVAPPPLPKPPNPYNPPCISAQESCAGRADGNYPMCYPECQKGFFFSCSNGETYEMPCALGWYTVNNIRFTHRLVYDPVTDSCELQAPYCPRTLYPPSTTTPPTVTTPVVTTPAPCNGKADIMFIMDASGSIGASNYDAQKTFMADLSKFFPVGQSEFLFSSIVFSSSASIKFKFNTHLNNLDVWQAVTLLPYIGGGTDTAEALELARLTGFTSSNGARTNAPKIAIVVTDGVSRNPSDTALEADRLHRSGVTVIVIGVGANIRLSELNAIASMGSNVFTVTGFATLNQIRNTVVQAACQGQQVASSCVSDSSSCGGRPDGNYASCSQTRQQGGYYWICSNDYGYETRCGVLWCYTQSQGYYTAYGVFNSVSGVCERDTATCPSA